MNAQNSRAPESHNSSLSEHLHRGGEAAERRYVRRRGGLLAAGRAREHMRAVAARWVCARAAAARVSSWKRRTATHHQTPSAHAGQPAALGQAPPMTQITPSLTSVRCTAAVSESLQPLPTVVRLSRLMVGGAAPSAGVASRAWREQRRRAGHSDLSGTQGSGRDTCAKPAAGKGNISPSFCLTGVRSLTEGPHATHPHERRQPRPPLHLLLHSLTHEALSGLSDCRSSEPVNKKSFPEVSVRGIDVDSNCPALSPVCWVCASQIFSLLNTRHAIQRRKALGTNLTLTHTRSTVR
ncbi:hypothetical protein E2C01_069719 [Portunus trituberculatus]|uniref:Uncharacterized protein n=1 Tax=Portunus trituberculatus TaxID=210409 RepID=A0A5B7I3K3_PORTR|nr:hypothetical protein [Portunus trituberculatus]